MTTRDLSMGQHPGVNFDLLDKQVRAAFPGLVAGISRDKVNTITIHFLDDGVQNDVETYRVAAEAVLAAHVPTELTPEQTKAEKARAALAELGVADYQAWKTGVEGITSLAQAKTRLEQLGRVVFLLLQAQGINETP